MEKKLVLILAFVSVMSIPAAAYTYTNWTGGAANNNWSDADNWSRNHYPSSDETARIGETGAVGVYLDIDAEVTDESRLGYGDNTVSHLFSDVYDLHIIGAPDTSQADFRLADGAGSVASINLTGTGSFTVDGNLRVGYLGTGTINISSASAAVTVDKDIYMGYNAGASGTINQTAGTVTMSSGSRGLYIGYADDGQYNLHGGTLVAGTLIIYSGTGNLDITEGTMTLTGNVVDDINTMYGDGRITAYSGIGNLVVTSDETYTYVSAVPEPATVVILGAGAFLGLFRRRRS